MPQTIIREDAQIALPQEVVIRLRLETGDILNVDVEDGKIILSPEEENTLEYNPEIKASIQRGLKDAEEGRTYGPFDNADDFLKSLKS
ncbi:MAG: AbrB/MazE/SpoVT family DNA-binding domain-containing protein [Candidatus Omnitrophota bacterium]